MPKEQLKLLNAVDKVSLRLVEEQEHHEIQVFENEVVTTISLVKTNKYDNWMKQPAKTVIDKDGVRSYDSRGALQVDVPHSDISKKQFEDNLATMVGGMPQLSFDHVDLKATEQLRKEGFTIQQGKKGRFVAKSPTKMLIYDPENKVVEERDLLNGEVQFSERQKFATNTEGQTVRESVMEVTLEIGRDSMKFWRVREAKYSNYHVFGSSDQATNAERLKTSPEFSTNSEQLAITPNPAQNDIWVQVPLSMQRQSPTIRIFDVNGRQVFNQLSDYVIQQIAVDKLPNGVYILQVETPKGFKVSKRFVKQ